MVGVVHGGCQKVLCRGCVLVERIWTPVRRLFEPGMGPGTAQQHSRGSATRTRSRIDRTWWQTEVHVQLYARSARGAVMATDTHTCCTNPLVTRFQCVHRTPLSQAGEWHGDRREAPSCSQTSSGCHTPSAGVPASAYRPCWVVGMPTHTFSRT